MINKYPDGSSYANVVQRNYASITHRINSYEDLWHLGQILEAANHNGVKPRVFIPNLIDAQADRRFDKCQSFGLKLVLDFLNQFEVTSYDVFAPHNPEVVEMHLKNSKIVSPASVLVNVIGKCKSDNLILMSADAGGYKPLMKLCEEINWKGETMSASKSRSWDGVKSVITQTIPDQDLTGKDILIVDDLCVYGGTFKGLSDLLEEKNARHIDLYVSHLTIQNHRSSKPVFDYFDDVYTTNSKYDRYYVDDKHGEPKYPDNLTIIPVL